MTSPTDRDVAAAARLLGLIRSPGGTFRGDAIHLVADELAALRDVARREGYADGERAAGKASELGLWDRFMVAILSGPRVMLVADMARMADEAVTERKKRKKGGV